MIPRFHRAVHSVPFAVDNKQTSWVALPDPKAQRLGTLCRCIFFEQRSVISSHPLSRSPALKFRSF